MIRQTLFATTALGLMLAASTALAQTAIPEAAPVVPPVSPTEPSQRPEQFGQFLQRGETVAERPRPEYDPLGIHLGAFFLYPKLEATEVYNDNVFATKTQTRDDFITIVSPSFNLLSNWSNHQLNLHAGASVGSYINNSTEDYGDYFVGTDGRFDISRNLSALGAAKYEHLHEERDAIDIPTSSKHPIEFDAYTASLGLTQHGLRIGYLANVDFRREEYANGATPSGIVILENTRDLNIFTPSVRVSYELAPRYEAFVRGEGNLRRYDKADFGIGPLGTAAKRDSNGFRADIGGRIDLSGITFAEISIGYLEQDYDAPALSTIRGLDANARVVWNVTQLTSLSLDASRNPQDDNSIALGLNGQPVTTPGYLRSQVGLSVDHELLRNVLLHGEARYENDDYKGISRTEDRVDIGAGARYLLTRHLYLGGSYTYTTRSSSGTFAFGAFDRNLFLIRLGAQL